MRIGVAAVQGAVSEHADTLRAAAAKVGVEVDVVDVRRRADFESTDALVIPGGESTTISKLFVREGLHGPIRRRVADEDYPILGTCAGLILLAKEGDRQVVDTRTELLGVLDCAVDRNAFGRQRESFEQAVSIDIAGTGAPAATTFPAVFIRAPAVTRVWGTTQVVSTFGERIIGVRQGRRLGLAFHPELSGDTRIHEAFLRSVRGP